MAFFTALIAFIVTILVLVTVHEFGHFWVAKKFGIKVLRFSIGFGKVLKSWQYGETTYTLCALPLGGFVKMLDENEAEVAKEEKHRAFNQQSVYTRIAVVAAGPLANFLLAILLYTVVFVIGVDSIKPTVGAVEKNGIAAQSDLKVGDQLLAINGQNTPSISEFLFAFTRAASAPDLTLEVRSKTHDLKTLTVDLPGDFLANLDQGAQRYLGFKFALPSLQPIIDQVETGSAAGLAGIQANDQILSANGVSIDTWRAFVKIIQNNPNKPIKLQVLRANQTLELSLTPNNKNGVGKAGISVITPKNYKDEWYVLVKKDWLAAFLSANKKVWQLSWLNLQVIKKMILGEVSIKQISGPIGIADYAGKTAQSNLTSFLIFLAFVSIGLGLLNLLPIPLLDGGHLFFYLLEILKGSPVSQIFQQIATKLGLLFILSLMLIAVYNDLLRLLA